MPDPGTEVIEVAPAPAVPMPGFAITTAEFQKQMSEFAEFVSTQMVDGQDYGLIPGTGSRKTLLKPGAEKLCFLFGLTIEQEITHRVEDFDRSFPLIIYESRTSLTDRSSKHLIATGEGSCNSMETKYRYRGSKAMCPDCNIQVYRQKKKPGWQCWESKGGCEKVWTDAQIGAVERIENPDVADQLNTILKMAHKRSLVDATLKAVRGSGVFTQDMEDLAGNNPQPNAEAASDDPKPSGAEPSMDAKFTDKGLDYIEAHGDVWTPAVCPVHEKPWTFRDGDNGWWGSDGMPGKDGQKWCLERPRYLSDIEREGIAQEAEFREVTRDETPRPKTPEPAGTVDYRNDPDAWWDGFEAQILVAELTPQEIAKVMRKSFTAPNVTGWVTATGKPFPDGLEALINEALKIKGLAV